MKEQLQRNIKATKIFFSKKKESFYIFTTKVQKELFSATAEKIIAIIFVALTAIGYSIYYNLWKNPVMPITLTVCVYDTTNSDTIQPLQSASLTVADFSVREYTKNSGCVTFKIDIRKNTEYIDLYSHKKDYEHRAKKIFIPLDERRKKSFRTRFHLKHKGLPKRVYSQSSGEHSLFD
ncbi:MAG: hypothetical protein ACI8RP_000678 [Urechidicola sp.]|jgi:hypothetical protein